MADNLSDDDIDWIDSEDDDEFKFRACGRYVR